MYLIRRRTWTFVVKCNTGRINFFDRAFNSIVRAFSGHIESLERVSRENFGIAPGVGKAVQRRSTFRTRDEPRANCWTRRVDLTTTAHKLPPTSIITLISNGERKAPGIKKMKREKKKYKCIFSEIKTLITLFFEKMLRRRSDILAPRKYTRAKKNVENAKYALRSRNFFFSSSIRYRIHTRPPPSRAYPIWKCQLHGMSTDSP